MRRLAGAMLFVVFVAGCGDNSGDSADSGSATTAGSRPPTTALTKSNNNETTDVCARFSAKDISDALGIAVVGSTPVPPESTAGAGASGCTYTEKEGSASGTGATVNVAPNGGRAFYDKALRRFEQSPFGKEATTQPIPNFGDQAVSGEGPYGGQRVAYVVAVDGSRAVAALVFSRADARERVVNFARKLL